MKPSRLAIVVVSVLFVFIGVSRVSGSAAGQGGASAGAADGSPSAAPPDWQPTMQRQIAAEEYEVTWQTSPQVEALDAAWQAPNRAHNLRTYFVAKGIHVVPRTEETPSWKWGLGWVGYGRGGQSWGVAPATLEAKGARVDYHRGMAEEWYENSPRGLEQGFVLAMPPEEAGRAGGTEAEAVGTVPPGRGRGESAERLAHIDLALTGDLRPVLSEDGQAIDFAAPGGAYVVHYAELKVTDARDTALPSWFEGFTGPGGGGIRIVIDDREAVYPVTVDPLATSPAWTAESDQASASFGWSVATAGDVNGDGYSDVIVGAPNYDNGQTDEGRAYVYLGSASGLSSAPTWTTESNQNYVVLGRSVGTAGDVNGDGYSDVIVGASYYTNDQTNEGRAYVYLGSASGLSPSPAWTGEGDQASAYFGTSVGTAGDVNGDSYSDVIVGAEGYDNGQTDEGRAFVYLGSASGLALTPVWTAESDQANARFGIAVGTAGDVNCDGYADVIIGAYAYDNVEAEEGRAYVYLGSSGGLALSPVWAVESNQVSAYFGYSVGTAGDVNGDGYSDVIVGAYAYDNSTTNEGRASVYLGNSSGLGPGPAWTVAGNQGWANFGYSVGTAGDVNGDGYSDVIVGAMNFDNGQTDEGRASVYLGSRTGLSLTPAWTGESDQASAWFGRSVGTAGDVNGDGYSDVVVGAVNFDNGQTDEGRAYLYLGSAAGVSSTDVVALYTGQAGEKFGTAVGGAGDVNGDGYADVVVGAPWYDSGETDEGRVVAYLGSSAGLSTSIAWSVEGNQAGALFGYAAGTAGDVNGDGYADVAIGAYLYDNGEIDEGRAFVYHGGPAGLATTPAWTVEPDDGGANFGYALSTAGDVNGDGYADLIVGAPLHMQGLGYPGGRAFVYLGSAAGLAASPVWYGESGIPNSNYGCAVAGGADANGDGFDDILVGANLMTYGGQSQEGYVRFYSGSLTGIEEEFWIALQADQPYAGFGTSVAWAGDVNGDGYADAIVGAPNFDVGQTDEGRVFLYLGDSSSLNWWTPAWTADGGQAGAHLGAAVAAAGDVNGDGYADVVVGAPDYDNGQTDEGKVSVHLGSAAGLAASPDFTSEGNQATANLGNAVASAGDANGDGYADVVVGMSGFDTPQVDSGRVYLFHGGGGRAIAPRPRQLRSNGTTPIANHGMSDTADGFRLALINRSPFGRTRGRLEWEVKPLGTLFNGVLSGASSSWRDTGAVGTDLNEAVGGLTAGLRYHWRARLRFDPSRTPFQSRGRWVTIPWGGWQEADLRTRVLAELDVSQSDREDPVMAGAQVTYDVDLHNMGPDAAALRLEDTMPDGITYVSAVPSQGSCRRSYQVVTCSLGMVAAGEHALVAITVTSSGLATLTNTALGLIDGRGDDPANNTWIETTTVVAPAVGDRVWKDMDADGIQDPEDTGMAGVVVAAYRQDNSYAGSAGTDANGYYEMTGLTYGESYYLRFTPPENLVFTLRDAGGDDSKDSDPDPATWRTATFQLLDSSDMYGWDAGVTLDGDGDGYTPWYNDCDDNDPTVYPGAPQVCDGKNNDCNDTSWPAVQREEQDRDGDGYRYCNGDCNDFQPSISPGQAGAEACDGYDNNCDGRVDEGCDAICDLAGAIGSEIDLTPTAVNTSSPRLAWTGSSYGMIFTDTRDGNLEVYFALLDANLNKIGADVRVTDNPGISTAPQIAWTGTYFGVAWQDERDGNQEIYFALLNISGVRLTGDVRVTNAAGNSRVPRIAWSGSDFGILWNDARDGSLENYFVRLDEYGQPLGAERRVTATPFDSAAGRFTWTGSVYGVVYADVRDGDSEVYLQTLDRYGNPVTPETRLTAMAGSSRTPSIAWDGAASQFGVAWVDNRSGSDQLFFARVAADGTKLTGDQPLVPVVNPSAIVVSIVHSGGEYALAWTDQSVGGGEVYFARLAQDALNGAPVQVTNNPASDTNALIEWTGSGYTITFADNRAGGAMYHAYAARIGCCTASTLGDRVWSDTDNDGLQDAGEPGAPGVLVALYDDRPALIGVTLTAADGSYAFANASCGHTYMLQVVAPAGRYFSPPHQGDDELLDSDADPTGGIMGPFMLTSSADGGSWDAGLHDCWVPDEPVFIANVRLSPDGYNYPILDYQDPNQPEQATGYNVRRSSSPSPPPETWPLVATDVIDMDEATPNKQWVDQSGDVSPTGAWYYQVTAYSNRCAAEGPF